MVDKEALQEVLDSLDDNQEEFKNYIRRKLNREEALRVFARNIHENEVIDRESARTVYEGLRDILLSEKLKERKEAINSFNVELPPKGKRLSDFLHKKPVGRPSEPLSLKEIKKDHKEADENVVYYEVLIALDKLAVKRGKNASRVAKTEAFRKVAKDRGKRESEKTISVMFYEAKKRHK